MSPVITLWFLSSYLHDQRPRGEVLHYLHSVASSFFKHGRVVVDVRHVDDDRGDVAQGLLTATSLHREVVRSRDLEIQRSDEGQKTCRTRRAGSVSQTTEVSVELLRLQSGSS